MSIAERPDTSGPLPGPTQRPDRGRGEEERWTEATGAHLLVVDPLCEEQLVQGLAARGIHVTVVSSALDALVEFGRSHARAVIIAPEAVGLRAETVISVIRRFGDPLVIAAFDPSGGQDARPALLAGAAAAITRPYTVDDIWELMRAAQASLDEYARVSFGPIELDARAYTVRINGERINDLPLREFVFLRTLLFRAPEVVSNAELRTNLYGHPTAGPRDNAIAVHAARLRGKLRGVAVLRRIRRQGYSLTLS